MARRYLLTFDKTNKQWVKVIGPKKYYFGKGKSKSDIASYNLALAKHDLKQLELMGLKASRSIDTERPTRVLLPPADGKTSRGAWRDPSTLLGCADRWIAYQMRRLNEGTIGTGAMSFRISAMNTFLKWCNKKCIVVGGAKKYLEGDRIKYYRQHLSNRVVKGTLKPHSANLHLQNLKAFIWWCWEEELIANTPRKIKRVAGFKVKRSSNKKVIDTETIREIFNSCPSDTLMGKRMKCFIALACNCGYAQQSISSLTVDQVDLENKRITRPRPKTGVMSSHKLWDVTVQLLKETQSEDPIQNEHGDDLFFKTINGNPLVWKVIEAPSDSKPKGVATKRNKLDSICIHGTDSIGGRFRYLKKRIELASNVSWKGFRKWGASTIANMDINNSLLLAQYYLAHSPSTVAEKHYIQKDTDNLDVAIDELEKILDLKL